MRLTMGWILLQGGLTKVVTYLDADPSNDWTAAGFLANAIPAGNPFEGAFAAMAGNPLVDALVMAGLTLTGIGVVLGAALRWNAFWGAVMMLLFWAASLQGGLAAGLPVAHGFVVDSHVVREHAALRYLLG
jgi:thiosulfate dehydrogenase [quinone] large subunit